MEIEVTPIKDEKGGTLGFDVAGSYPNLDLGGRACVKGPLRVTGTVTNLGDQFIVDGVLSTMIEARCDRCLSAVTLEIESAIQAQFHKDKGDGEEGSAPTEEGDDPLEEILVVQQDRLRLDDVVRDELLVSLPMKILCRQDCRGLCPQCGQNLNEGTCDCEQEALDPRLAPLARLLDDDSDNTE